MTLVWFLGIGSYEAAVSGHKLILFMRAILSWSPYRSYIGARQDPQSGSHQLLPPERRLVLPPLAYD